jgi:DNA-binding response OmpR family regulator
MRKEFSVGNKKILLVDDEQDLVETMEMSLEAKGFEILKAYDGEEGLKLAIEANPDLIILDLMMPKMNGYQVCWEIKNNEKTKHLRVIMLTAKAQESDKFWGYETGADDYVTKPFEMAELVKKINSFLAD